MLVQHRVDEVTSVAVGTFSDLLERAKVVHPVKFGLLLDLVIPSHEDIHLERRATAQALRHLGANEVCSGIYTRLETCSDLLKLQVSHHKVGELIAVLLFASAC